ncbi:MAG: hypothetical protein U9N54_10175 [candidate division Zixibacteria bacterium]|nr:hypothetical protein [candidate division Zixibacteria bacterium]
MESYDEKFMCWARYLFWAEICRNRLESLFDSSENSEEISTNEFIAYSSQWYGSLYVVIEGWEKLELNDAMIDKLLIEHENLIELLKRYRNGVFHFQTKLLDNRFIDFWKAKDNSYLWARLLHEEFIRYFSDYLASAPGDSEQKREIKNSIKEVIGWVPEGTFNDRVRALDELLHEAEALINKNGEETPETRDFRRNIDFARQKIIEARNNYDVYLEKNFKSIRVGG